MESKYTSADIFTQYVNVMNEYLVHFTQSSKYKKNERDKLYLLLNGLSTLTHVFNVILFNTVKPVLALENMQKSIYYYTQFIDQIEENALNDLNISSISASVFVYNKTIKEIKEINEINEINAEQYYFLNNCMKLVELYRIIMEMFINNDMEIKETIKKTTNCINQMCKNGSDEKSFHTVLTNVSVFLRHVSEENSIYNNINIYDAILVYLKKYKEVKLSVEGLCRKKASSFIDYDLKTNAASYIKWLVT
jgi:hypothetical protein